MASISDPRPASRRPAGALFEACFLVLVAIVPIVTVHATWRGYVIPPADVVFLLAAAAFLASLVLGERRFRRSPLYLPLAAYAAALTLSAAASEDPWRSAVKLAGEYYLFGLAVLTVNYVDDGATARRMIRAWLAGAAASVAAGLAGLLLFAAGATGQAANPFLDIHGSLPPGLYPRVMASFVNANALATYLAASLALTLAAARLGWIASLAFRLLVAGTLVVGVFSLSPGIGGIVLVLGLWYSAEWKARARTPAALLAVAAWMTAAAFVAAVAVSPPGTHAASPRVMTWASAWRTFRLNPWLGRGLGLDAADVRYTNASGVVEALTDAHNAWLSILAQAGVVGAVAFAVLLGRLLVLLRPVPAGEPRRTLAIGVFLALAGGFLFQSLSGSFEDSRHVWLIVGLAAAVPTLTNRADG